MSAELRIETLTNRFGTLAYEMDTKVVIIFLSAHVPLALLISKSEMAASIYLIATLATGLWCVATDDRIERVAYIAAYIVGAEVLWRMTNTVPVWETGKYATAALFILAMIRFQRLRVSILSMAYFALLLPSIWSTLGGDPAIARSQISFYLSGPFALMVSACFFYQLKLSSESLQRLFLMLIGPVIGVAAIAFYGILTTPNIEFGTSSNFETSGGFGPNQVSAVLGLGALLALLLVVSNKLDIKLRALMFFVVMLLAAQSAMTFSRGGLDIAIASAVVALVFLLKSRHSIMKVCFLTTVLILIGYFILLPYLDAFTKGALSARFQDTDSTRRVDLIQDDLDTWSDNPAFGVGIGESKFYHQATLNREIASHTEFSRLLAEHGTLGLAAFVLILLMGAVNLKRARTTFARATVAALICWSLLYMSVNAMRIVAPSFIFGLTFAEITKGRLSFKELSILTQRYRLLLAYRLRQILINGKLDQLQQ
jgi:hypothetical protein